MEIKGSTPKEVQYIHTLRQHFSRSWKRRLKDTITRTQETYSLSDLAEVLNHKNDDYAYQFLKKLVEDDVLEKAGKRENASGTVHVYRFHKDRLYTTFSKTDYYQENRDLFTATLEKAEGKELI